MKIAVDFQSVEGRKTGIGVAAENLLAAMQAAVPETRFLFYTARKGADLNTPQRIFWESARIPVKAIKDRPDLIYSPGFAPPIWSHCPRVVTVHDLIGIAHPGNQGIASSFYWGRWLPLAIRNATRIVASSYHTQKDIERFLKIPASRVQVVPLGAHGRFRKMEDQSRIDSVLAKHALSRPYWIAVGTLEPRKNLLRLIEAFGKMKEADAAGLTLAVVGKRGDASGMLETWVKEHRMEKRVRFLGYVEEDELTPLYNGAMGYACVSLYEGFGLPALEAMSCGLTGVVSDRTSLPEVVGETAIFVDPENVSEIASALDELTKRSSFRESLALKALARSQQFSNRRAALKMIGIFKECA